MDIYKDYKSYIKEQQSFIDHIKALDLHIYFVLEDTFKVLDYLAGKHEDGVTLDPDEDEIFDLGFGFITNLLESLTFYCHNYLHDDDKMLLKYNEILFYFCVFDDIKGFLGAEDMLDDETQEKLSDIDSYIDDVLQNKKNVTEDELNHLSELSQSLIPVSKDYQPTFSVFSLIADELGVY